MLQCCSLSVVLRNKLGIHVWYSWWLTVGAEHSVPKTAGKAGTLTPLSNEGAILDGKTVHSGALWAQALLGPFCYFLSCAVMNLSGTLQNRGCYPISYNDGDTEESSAG